MLLVYISPLAVYLIPLAVLFLLCRTRREYVSYLLAGFILLQLWGITGMPGAKYIAGTPYMLLYFALIFSQVWMIGLLIFEAFTYTRAMKVVGFHNYHLYILLGGLLTEGSLLFAIVRWHG